MRRGKRGYDDLWMSQFLPCVSWILWDESYQNNEFKLMSGAIFSWSVSFCTIVATVEKSVIDTSGDVLNSQLKCIFLYNSNCWNALKESVLQWPEQWFVTWVLLMIPYHLDKTNGFWRQADKTEDEGGGTLFHPSHYEQEWASESQSVSHKENPTEEIYIFLSCFSYRLLPLE